jgi:uncharacterized protein (UPF0218 family)
MDVAYQLPKKLRKELKRPLGMLICGSYQEVIGKLRALIEKEKPPCIIAVGDMVSKNLTDANINLKLVIVDNKIMRANIEPVKVTAEEERDVKNPPGTITFEALDAIKEALETNHTFKIVVEGEEDLLTLPAIQYAPENSIIVYGQPYEGIVVVKATEEKKAEVCKILEKMRPRNANREAPVSEHH